MCLIFARCEVVYTGRLSAGVSRQIGLFFKRAAATVDISGKQVEVDKGKLVARRGRKARGLTRRDSSAADSNHTFKEIRVMPIPSSIRPPRGRTIAVALTGALCLTAAFGSSAASARGVESILTTTTSGISVLETPETRQTCAAPTLVSAFASLGDSRDYVLAPGGSFEDKDLDGWQVQKAKSEGGGSPLELTDDDNERSLKVPPGGSATSPAMCVDLHYPTMRLMAKPKQGKGQLQVEVIYPDSDNPVFHPAGSLAAGDKDWGASDDISVFPERGGAAAGMRRVALRFTSVAAADGEAGEWRIDDVYVDPHRR